VLRLRLRRPRPSAFRASGRALVALGLLALACGGPRRLEHVPGELIGLWKTSAPRYAQHFLRIEPGFFVLGVAGMDLDRLRVDAVDEDEDGDGHRVYRLHYTADEGYADALVLTYVINTHGTASRRALRIGSRPDLWTPAASR
jgi:hypothetical protein